ncbi:MAG: flagellar motility protein MotE (MotC chaperone) [Sulfurimonas sp.]|jgi:flagellar motility protein MotE (MotC chaperone)|uniref:MotE family protein n=1 Tax=Sulfurimonas sp. TaxID=2022749 RepID=UPI0039E4AEA3
MKIFLFILFTFSSLVSLQTSDRLFDCTEVFKERKNELLVELERIDEQKQALSALQAATEDLLKKKEGSLTQKAELVDVKLASITKKEENIKNMLTKNEKALKELKSLKMNKIAQTYAKMKAGAASSILSDMDEKEAAAILSSLKPKTVGQILTKMDARKASKLTLLLVK